MANGFGDNIHQFIAMRLRIFDDLPTHARFPKISDVLLYTLNGEFSIGFGFEESANVVCHLD